jgi:1,4-alpha-glucan branching enzyme
MGIFSHYWHAHGAGNPIKIMARLDDALTALAEAREHDPFRRLGLHRIAQGWRLRVYRPDARAVSLESGDALQPLTRLANSDFFEWEGTQTPRLPYRLRVHGRDGADFSHYDPYAFPPAPSEHDLFLFSEGSNTQSYNLLGALPEVRQEVAGVCFRTWAPNAARVSVVGDFNRWDGRLHPMVSLGASGVWELFIPELPEGTLYKFEIRQRAGGTVAVKIDPYGREFEVRPSTAPRVNRSSHTWDDVAWMAARERRDWLHAPMSIYEVHAGSWMRHPDGRFYSYRELAVRLVPYVRELGCTHIEFLPLMEHPLDESWGYQCTGFFAPSSRFGSPDDLRFLIDACHQAGLGVILDWVPGHFPRDSWALAHYDGTALYEHEDPRRRLQPDWGTYAFNFGRNEVKSFLLSSAHWWLSEFHADGLRVDAVASMLYLDYSRRSGEWVPNAHGGRENLEAIDFLRRLNEMVHRDFPGAITVAEESTAWPMVSRPAYLGGLGFSMKWNMGWMNDTLSYMRQDPVYRRFSHDRLTFGQLYAYSENFVLPLSHDEVVHGKGALLQKMPGDRWQQLANLRLLLAYQMTTPGKKLLFMGAELAQAHEWRASEELPWDLLNVPEHAGTRLMLRELNRLYTTLPALHELDFDSEGFAWIDCHDADQSVVSWLRQSGSGQFVAVALNFTPVPRPGYRIGVPKAGYYRELFNSDSRYFGGSDMGNGAGLVAGNQPWMGRPCSLKLTLPPLAAVVLGPAD